MDRKLYLKSYLENLVKKDKPENVLGERESESLKNAFSGKCPACKMWMTTIMRDNEIGTKFCPHCGQHLHWKLEDKHGDWRISYEEN